jgi:hypothetical protein
MPDSGPIAKEAVYLLADHLDAALAAGEDLLAAKLAPLAGREGDGADPAEALSRFVARLRRLEGSILARVLQVRRRLADLPRNDTDIRPVARLFVASTDLLVGLVETFGDRPEARFNRGDDPISFLRERGLIAPEAAGLPPFQVVEVGESYRIGAVVELGPLMDMIAGLLDLLDRRYDLYATDGAPLPVALSGDESLLDVRPLGSVVPASLDTPFAEPGKPAPQDSAAKEPETAAAAAQAASPEADTGSAGKPDPARPQPTDAAGQEAPSEAEAKSASSSEAKPEAAQPAHDDLHPTAASLMKALDDLQRAPSTDDSSKPASPAP